MIQPLPILPACRQTHSCALAYQHKDKEPAAGKGAPEDRSCHQVICGAVRHAEEGQHCHPHTTPTRHLRACRGLLHALHAHGTRAQCTHRGTTDGRRDQRQGWSFPAPTAGLPRWTRGLGTPGSAGAHPPRHQLPSAAPTQADCARRSHQDEDERHDRRRHRVAHSPPAHERTWDIHKFRKDATPGKISLPLLRGCPRPALAFVICGVEGQQEQPTPAALTRHCLLARLLPARHTGASGAVRELLGQRRADAFHSLNSVPCGPEVPLPCSACARHASAPGAAVTVQLYLRYHGLAAPCVRAIVQLYAPGV